MAHWGIAKVYAGKLNDSTSGLSATNIIELPSTRKLVITPTINDGESYGNNVLVDQASVVASQEIALALNDLSASQQAFLLGQMQPSEGGVAASAEDGGEPICLFYKAPLSRKKNGVRVNRYGWIYKIVFKPFEDSMETLQGKPDFDQIPSLTGKSQPTDYIVTDSNGVERHLFSYFVDDDDPNCPADIATTWYNTLHVPNANTDIPTVVVAPANSADDVLATASVVWTFSKVINSLCVTESNFIVIKADGTAVDGTLSVDSTGKIVTFDPADNLTASATYIAIASKNITDCFGVSIANTNIAKFTVAAS